ncbi:LysR family transcriptional regulator [Thalassotalea sp. PS06]|uniref:LysR family transcriptional regulator n=1 Tax=Thalassotalea sp. PS06 TaxID=2594005 RepID=UPI001162349C|nr:LysR family transcriptional regulator [Thalassotalea sp. PS06]QDP02838.1 LysR family transcriptional regulator [Thalassotalea sp. PS06]
MKEHKKLERLMLFAEVASQLSFTRAADKLGMSRGYLSTQMRALEQQLGNKLLIRSTRSVRLTAAGEKVLKSAKHIQQTMLEMERLTEQDSQDISGVIKITAPLQFNQSVLVNLCSAFNQKYPQVSFAIDSSYDRRDLISSDFDLAFRATKNPPENMIARKLFSYQHCLVASSDYLQRKGTPKTIEDLQRHQCLTGLEQGDWNLAGTNIEINGWLKVNDNLLLKHQAMAGQGVVKVPDYFVSDEVEKGSLVTLMEQFKQSPNDMYLLYPQLVYQSKRVATFIDFIAAEFS